jgi:hypothetical protein
MNCHNMILVIATFVPKRSLVHVVLSPAEHKLAIRPRGSCMSESSSDENQSSANPPQGSRKLMRLRSHFHVVSSAELDDTVYSLSGRHSGQDRDCLTKSECNCQTAGKSNRIARIVGNCCPNTSTTISEWIFDNMENRHATWNPRKIMNDWKKIPLIYL